MRIMNCRNVCREIEEVASGDLLSTSASDHLKNCPQCATFHDERLKLREMLSSLGSVEAPGDFDFRLRARLANERRAGAQPFVMRNFSFGLRSVAAAAMLLLVGAALLFVSFRTSPNNSLSADGSKAPAIPGPKPAPSANPDTIAGVIPGSRVVAPIQVPVKLTERHGTRRFQSASLRGKPEMSGGLATLEQSSNGAQVLRPVDATRAFPIEASYQSLKVSLDNGRGTSRTISLPSVSFGSQRVLSQTPSPLLASARGDW